MYSPQVRRNVVVPGDLDARMLDDDLGDFLNQDSDLGHLERARINMLFQVYGHITVEYNPPDPSHRTPIDVYIEKVDPGVYSGEVRMLLSPSHLDKEKALAKLADIETKLADFIAKQDSVAPAPRERKIR